MTDFFAIAEAEGFYFATEAGGRDIFILYMRPPHDTTVDNIAFGFMTWYANGTLLRADGISGHFIDVSLVSMDSRNNTEY
jgi:hypothetical protein